MIVLQPKEFEINKLDQQNRTISEGRKGYAIELRVDSSSADGIDGFRGYYYTSCWSIIKLLVGPSLKVFAKLLAWFFVGRELEMICY